MCQALQWLSPLREVPIAVHSPDFLSQNILGSSGTCFCPCPDILPSDVAICTDDLSNSPFQAHLAQHLLCEACPRMVSHFLPGSSLAPLPEPLRHGNTAFSRSVSTPGSPLHPKPASSLRTRTAMYFPDAQRVARGGETLQKGEADDWLYSKFQQTALSHPMYAN